MINVFIPGIPQPQPRPRTVTHGGRTWTYSNSPAVKAWKQQIDWAVKPYTRMGATDAALKVNLRFLLPRPKHHYRSGKYAGELNARAPRFHTVKPDLSNLLKAVEDALEDAGLYRDDKQICLLRCEKCYASLMAEPGLEIKIEGLF